jgi:D-glucosaminate-specific PTS system IIB component
LIHGQVVTAWVGNTNCNVIYVIDDLTAKNPMVSKMYGRLAPAGTTCEVFSTTQAADELKKEPSSSDERIMLLAKVPQVFEALVDSGVQLKELNLGGMGLSRNRKPFYDNVSADQEEIDSMKRMIEKGVVMTYQVAPYSKAVSVKKIIENTRQ